MYWKYCSGVVTDSLGVARTKYGLNTITLGPFDGAGFKNERNWSIQQINGTIHNKMLTTVNAYAGPVWAVQCEIGVSVVEEVVVVADVNMWPGNCERR